MQDAIVAALNSEPYPNPKVGAVLVSENGTIKSIGVHKGPGTNHAELEVINNSEISSEDTLYVTLEPCFHTDSSPSCAEEILKTPLKNIVIGDIDLDDRTKGKSIDLLKENNINVRIEENANLFLNPHYKNQKLLTNKPTLIGKIATSQNNYIYEDNSSDEDYEKRKTELRTRSGKYAGQEGYTLAVRDDIVTDQNKFNKTLESSGLDKAVKDKKGLHKLNNEIRNETIRFQEEQRKKDPPPSEKAILIQLQGHLNKYFKENKIQDRFDKLIDKKVMMKTLTGSEDGKKKL